MPEELSLRQNMLWNSAGSLMYLGCQWMITILVVRLSDNYDAAGALTLAMSVFGIFSPIAEYRMYIYQVSDIRRENTVGEYVAFRAITCSASLVLCLGYSFLTCSRNMVLTIFLYGIYRCMSTMIDVLHAEDQVGGRMDYIGKSLSLQGVVSIVLFSIVFILTGNLDMTFLSMAGGMVAVGVFYDIPHTKRFGKIGFGISGKKVIFLCIFCAPAVIGFVACATAPSIPRQVLFDMYGEAALGVYGSVSAPAAIIQAGASYIYNPLMQYFAGAYAVGDKKQFNMLLIKVSLGILAFAVICFVLLLFLGEPLLVLVFGDSIKDYVYLLPLIVVASVAIAYMGLMNGILLAIRMVKAALIGGVAALIVSFATTFYLVGAFEMNGVSLVLLVSSLIACLTMTVCLMHKANHLDCDEGQ